MSVEVLFQFGGGPRGVVVLDYDHFKHGSKGTWSTMCPLIGQSNERVPNPTPGRPAPAGGDMEVIGTVCSLYEKAKGKKALVAQLQSYPKLGGVSGQELKSRNFQGSFRIYRAAINDGNGTGTWQITGQNDNCMDYNWALTSNSGPAPAAGSQATPSAQPTQQRS